MVDHDCREHEEYIGVEDVDGIKFCDEWRCSVCGYSWYENCIEDADFEYYDEPIDGGLEND